MTRARTLGPLLAAAFAVATPGVAWGKRKDDKRATPPKKKRKDRIAEREARDWSEGGTRRGAIEFTLGGAAVLVFGVLVGRGAWEIVKGQ